MMTASRPSRPTGLILSACVCVLLSAPARGAEPEHHRVAILDIDTDGVDASAVPDLIAEMLARHPEYQVTSREEMQKTLSLWRHPVGCIEDASCVATVAGEAHADVVIGGTLKREGRKYALTLSLQDPRMPGASARATETMWHLRNVGLNVRLCLDRLLRGNGGSSISEAAAKPASQKEENVPAAPEQRSSRSPDDSWLHRRNNLT